MDGRSASLARCTGYFLVLALLPYPQAAVAAVPLTGLGQVRAFLHTFPSSGPNSTYTDLVPQLALTLRLFSAPACWIQLSAMQMTYPHLRSLFSLAVSRDAQGQLFSLISALETISTTLTPLVVNTVYDHSVHDFPGTSLFNIAGSTCNRGVMKSGVPHLRSMDTTANSAALPSRMSVS